MLAELSIQNLAIIDSLRLEFARGFNVLTGETGAGKSIIIDAMNLLLGGRASAEVIRTGRDEAVVEGVFELAPEAQAPMYATLEEYGLADDGGGQLILRREISRGRRNVCRANGRTVPLGVLQEIGGHLVDIHGQGDQLSLLRVRQHVGFLDRYGGLTEQRKAFAARAAELRVVRAELAALQRDARELARREDLLRYQIEEIDAAALRPDEEEELRRERSLLGNAEKLMGLAGTAYDLLSGGEGRQRAVMDQVGLLLDALTTLAKLDDTLTPDSRAVESIYYQLEDLAHMLRAYRDGVEHDPNRLEAVEERIDLMQALKRKYGDSLEDVLAYGERAERELNEITHSEERVEALRQAEAALLVELGRAGAKLSTQRREVAERLSSEIEMQLASLNMERARFLVDIRWVEAADGVPVGDPPDGTRYAFGDDGIDRVEFLIAPNPGEDPKPLAKTASGGETSRLMLAMKNVLSAADPVPTLIFDEIDAGIGGRTGSVVGHALWELSHTHQVFCVTHLAQIASFADRHFRVAKETLGERTVSSAKALSADQRVEELAVLLGGAATDATRQSAAELIARSGLDAPMRQEAV